MFESKPKPPGIVSAFDDQAIRWTVTGDWVTLALSRFQISVAAVEHRSSPEPTAYGVVHQDHATANVLPTILTFNARPGIYKDDRLGTMGFDGKLPREGDPGYLMLRVSVNDPDGRLTRELDAAFQAAASCGERFVHVHLKRDRPDADAIMEGLATNGHGQSMIITDVQFKRLSILPEAPDWSWKWGSMWW